jgi:hypothetical protein
LQDDTHHEEQTSQHDFLLTDLFRSKANPRDSLNKYVSDP